MKLLNFLQSRLFSNEVTQEAGTVLASTRVFKGLLQRMGNEYSVWTEMHSSCVSHAAFVLYIYTCGQSWGNYSSRAPGVTLAPTKCHASRAGGTAPVAVAGSEWGGALRSGCGQPWSFLILAYACDNVWGRWFGLLCCALVTLQLKQSRVEPRQLPRGGSSPQSQTYWAMSGLSLLCIDCYNCFSLPVLQREDVARIAFLCGWLLHLNVLPIKSIIVIC